MGSATVKTHRRRGKSELALVRPQGRAKYSAILVPTHLNSNDADRLGEESKESIEKARDLLDQMKVVQEHENAILEDAEDPEAVIKEI